MVVAPSLRDSEKRSLLVIGSDSDLARHWLADSTQGHSQFEITGTTRNLDSGKHSFDRSLRLQARVELDLLKSSIPPEIEGTEWSRVIIFAQEMRAQHQRRFEENLITLVKRLKTQTPTQILFISSLSAHSRNHSAYGQSKRRLEEWFQRLGASILRPGLVRGAGGLMTRLKPLKLGRFGYAPVSLSLRVDTVEAGALFSTFSRFLRDGTLQMPYEVTVSDRVPIEAILRENCSKNLILLDFGWSWIRILTEPFRRWIPLFDRLQSLYENQIVKY